MVSSIVAIDKETKILLNQALSVYSKKNQNQKKPTYNDICKEALKVYLNGKS